MPCVRFLYQDIYSLVQHHIALIERFPTSCAPRFSLMFINLVKIQEKSVSKVVEKTLRKSDAMFVGIDHLILLLPGNDRHGSQTLLSGIQDFLSQQMIDTIVTYPDDGQKIGTLLGKLQEMVKQKFSINLEFPDCQPQSK